MAISRANLWWPKEPHGGWGVGGGGWKEGLIMKERKRGKKKVGFFGIVLGLNGMLIRV